jgi:hypothetical protein
MLSQFLPFLPMVSDFLPLEHSSRKQLLSFLAFANFLAMTLGEDRKIYRTRKTIKELIMLRIMRRTLRCFASEELQVILNRVILNRLQHRNQHNFEGFTSMLCNTRLQPNVRLCLSYEFVTFLQSSNFRDRWFYILDLFPRRRSIQNFEFGFHVLVQEFRTLYNENRLFFALWNCSSCKIRQRIFYRALRRQTPSFRAFVKSIKRMRKALIGIFEFDPSLNLYQLSDSILEYFFKELQSMSSFRFRSLYDDIVDSLDPSETIEWFSVYYKDALLRSTSIPLFRYSRIDSKAILLLCDNAFSLPFISDHFLAESSNFAANKFHISDALLSQISKGIWFILSLISLHQRSDPFLGYVIRAFLNQDNPFFAFEVNTFLHTVYADGSTPEFVKFWREFCSKHRPDPLNLEIWVYEMLEFFYEIMSNEGFIHILDVLIGAETFDNVSHRTLCDVIRGTFIELYFSRMFYPVTYLSFCSICNAKINDRKSDIVQVCSTCRARSRGYWSDLDEDEDF